MIIVFGSLALDLVCSVKNFPSPGESIISTSFTQVPGSKGGNQALAAQRAGADVVHVGSVGEDENSDLALRYLREAGVDLSAVKKTDAATGTCCVTVAEHGENTVVVNPGANNLTNLDQLKNVVFGSADVLLLQMEIDHQAIFSAISLARKRGAVSILNLAPAAEIPAETLRALDYLILNESEAAFLAEQMTLPQRNLKSIAHELNIQFDCSTIVTLGEKGAIAYHKGVEHEVPAPRTQVVDTTAAGDSFTGAFAAAIQANQSFETALQHGVVAGSLACQVFGAQTSVPNQSQISQGLENYRRLAERDSVE